MNDATIPDFRSEAEVKDMRPSHSSGLVRRCIYGGAGIAFAMMLAGCGMAPQVHYPSVAADYHDQFPIVLGQGRETLNIFPAYHDGHIDSATQARLTQFINGYRKRGTSGILMQVPRGGAAARAAGLVRRELNEAGGRVRLSTYEGANPNLASPITLSFLRLKASVARSCGNWPSDLASGSSFEGSLNRPYYNYGCSQQQMLAAEVSDPRDLVGPRARTPSDSTMRIRSIEKVRNGVDPGTQWRTGVTNVSQAVQ